MSMMMMMMMTTRGRRLHHRSRVHDGRHRDILYPRLSRARPPFVPRTRSSSTVHDVDRRDVPTRWADAMGLIRVDLGRSPRGRHGGRGLSLSHDPRESQTHRLVQSHARTSPWDPIEPEAWMPGPAVCGTRAGHDSRKVPPTPGSPVPRARVVPGSPAEVDG
jgi:hypothetical protein